jgi:hypothetical protein
MSEVLDAQTEAGDRNGSLRKRSMAVYALGFYRLNSGSHKGLSLGRFHGRHPALG